MELVLATADDVDKIMELIDSAKQFLKQNGVDQWQSGYPNISHIEDDIKNSYGYLAVKDKNIIAYLCIDDSGEIAYNNIYGSWLSIQPYIVVHRFAVDSRVRGRGFASEVLKLAEGVGRAKGIYSFKVDTDNDNKIMKHILENNGFKYCGVINFENSEKIAYEKLI